MIRLKNWTRRVCAVAMTVAAICVVVGPELAAEERGGAEAVATVILLDATRDMARLKPGATAARFDLQFQALAAALGDAPAAAALAQFGGADCGGFRVAGDDPLDALADSAPAGARNLPAALDAAVAALPQATVRKRILAIVGGPNQCMTALCAHADRLKSARPDVAIDVIGFDISDEAARQLACVAANTGGRFARADENGLATALALTLGSNEAPRAAAEPREPPAVVLAETPPGLVGPTALADRYSGPELYFPRGLRLSATLVKGGPPLEEGVRFELLRRGPDGVLRLVARTVRIDMPLFAAPPGPYVARVTVGGLTRDHFAEAPVEGIVNRRLVLDAGQVELAATVAGRIVNSGARFRAERIDKAGLPIVITGRSRMLATLPAGRYRVAATVDGATSSQFVEVAAGAVFRETFDLALGYLRVAAPKRARGFRVLRGNRVVAEASADHALFRLPPGPYRVIGAVDGVGMTADATVEVGRLAAAALALPAAHKADILDDGKGPRRLIAAQPDKLEPLEAR